MSGSVHALVYAAVMGLVCAGALTAVDRLTLQRRLDNERADEVRTILTVVGSPGAADASPAELLAAYETDVTKGSFAQRESYTYDHPEYGRLTAIKFRGPGLWGPVEGILCLEADMRTVHAVSFYKHEETPGLGGEISSKRFQAQFAGKRIVSDDGHTTIRVVAGATGPNEVDAISGATITSNKVEAMLEALIRSILEQDQSNG